MKAGKYWVEEAGRYWVYVNNAWVLVDSTCVVPDIQDGTQPTFDPVPAPPLGPIPRRIWEEKRAADLSEAIQRYVGVPVEWIEEFLTLIKKEG